MTSTHPASSEPGARSPQDAPPRSQPAPPHSPTPRDVAASFDEHATQDIRVRGRHEPGRQTEHDDTADRVVTAVLAVPGVVRLHSGVFGEVATYLPGRAVTGVRLRPDETEVHLVASTARPIPEVARDVHAVVRDLVPGPVRVFVEDLEPSSSSPSAH